MDFWSRLIAGTPLASPAGNKAAANNPEKRLARFKREYSQLLSIWRAAGNLERDLQAAENIRNTLQDLTGILTDESRRPLPHPCITFASAKQIYIPIGKIATTSYNAGIIREAVAVFATLIDSEEEDFVENDIFSRSLMDLLVRITGANSIRLGSETEVEVVELSFNITTKIRLDPEILPAWFTAQERDEDLGARERDAHQRFTGQTHKEDFPLFYLLIDYIHHEGRTGDFARTGLLYIIEAASSSMALEQWIVESDLATLMATGLGALYSQLSRKLVIDHPPDLLPPILALSDYQHPTATFEIVSSASPDFQGHVDTFLSHLLFWQDVLNHCKSIEVKSTLLEHFQIIFLQQLLYPSLLESSDVDGGSSVAVLTYLRQILEALDHPDMTHLILHYLLALPDTTTSPTLRTSISAARQRKSMDLATLVSSKEDWASTPSLFNLVDLIQGSLRSQNPQTVSVTLQLVSVILRRHHRYAMTTLLWTSLIIHDGPLRTIGGHDKEMDFLLSLAGNIGGEVDFDEVFDTHIQDSLSVLESHPCSIPLVAPKSLGRAAKIPGSQATIPGAPREVRAHTLRPEDPMLKTLISILATFFTNSVDINLSLTAAIVDLATCGYMRLEGWLLPGPSVYIYDDDEEEDDDDDDDDVDDLDENPEKREISQLKALRRSKRTPSWNQNEIPALLAQLQALVEQVTVYRKEIPRFDDILQQRRDAFQAASAVTVSPIHTKLAPPRSSFESSSRSASPPRNPFDSLAQRIFPELGTPSRSHSPRGRRQDQPRRHGLATPPRSTAGAPPQQLPMGLETPSRGSSRAFSPSPLRNRDERAKSLGIPPSQTAAFAAVDQTILARKVGLPSLKGEMKPIPFPNLRDLTKLPVEGDAESAADDDTSVTEAGTEDATEAATEATTETSVAEEGADEEVLVTVSHLLTNVLLLQEFLLELAAMVQVRAGLFGEIKFV